MVEARLKTLMTADAVGGVWDYALELAGGLSRMGVTTVLAVMGPPPSAERRAKALAIPRLTLEIADYRLEWMDEARDDVRRAGDWLLALERRHGPDLVHVNGYAHALLPWRADCLAVAHSCVPTWWRAVKGEDAPETYAAYARDVARAMASRPMVFPTGALRAAMETVHGQAPLGRVILNGRDPLAYAPGSKERFVFSAGRFWDEAKNLAVLARAAAGLDWPVFVAGDLTRPDGRICPSPNGNVRCLGFLSAEAMAGWLGRATVFALPARYEPFGLAALEAALAGCALVLGDIPTLRELWDGAALFVDPGDEAALARTLAEVIRRPALAGRLGRQARLRGLSRTAERMTRQYLDFYLELLGESARPRPRASRHGSLPCASSFSPTR